MGSEQIQDIVIRTIYDDKGVKKGMEETRRSIQKLNNGTEKVTSITKKADGTIKGMTTTIQKQRDVFPMWSLSFLFAGMQIQRTAGTIIKSTTKMFLDVDRGNTEQSRALIGLSAQWDYMRFSIGRAMAEGLMPLLPIIQGLVGWFTRMVQAHPEVTFAAIASAFVLGTGLFLGGQMVLFASGISTLVANAGGLEKISAAIVAMGPYAAILAAIAVIGGIAWKAFSETPEAWNAIKESFNSLTGDGGAFSIFATGMEDLIKIWMPQFKMSWEDIAWTIAWALTIAIDGIAIVIKSFGIAGMAIARSLNLIRGLSAMIRGDDVMVGYYGGKADIQQHEIDKALTSLAGTYGDFGSAISQNPMEFKESRQTNTNNNQKSIVVEQLTVNQVGAGQTPDLFSFLETNVDRVT